MMPAQTEKERNKQNRLDAQIRKNPHLSSDAKIIGILVANNQKFQAQDQLNQLNKIRNRLPGQPSNTGEITDTQSLEDALRIPEHTGHVTQVIQLDMPAKPTTASLYTEIGKGYTGNRAGGALNYGNPNAYADRGNFGGENNFGAPEQSKQTRQELKMSNRKGKEDEDEDNTLANAIRNAQTPFAMTPKP